jgi:hypothetical protein
MNRKATIPNRARHRPKAKLENLMNRAKILGIVRHLLTTFGGGLVVSGKMSEVDFTSAVGAVVILVGAVWSYFSPEKQP